MCFYQCYVLLSMYSSGKVISELSACKKVGLNFRSPIQILRGDRFLNWNLINVLNDKGQIEGRYLDPRHLSKNRELDALARSERRCQFKKDSFKRALCGTARAGVAFKEYEDAQKEHSTLIENALPKQSV